MTISRPPVRDAPPLVGLESGNVFTALWERHFNVVRDEANNSEEHRADTDNPHETSDENIIISDVTDNDVSTSAHGFAPKLPDDDTKFFDGEGNYDTVKDSDLSLSDIEDNDVSITAHGFMSKLPNDNTKYYRGDGTWQTITIPQIYGGTFTINNAAFVDVADTNVTATCRIVCWPSNAAAGVLESSTSKLYTSAKSVGVGFTQSTADSGTVTATDYTYDYIIFDE